MAEDFDENIRKTQSSKKTGSAKSSGSSKDKKPLRKINIADQSSFKKELTELMEEHGEFEEDSVSINK